MTAMLRNDSVQGFSVSQPNLGAALQFIPAMGSQLLDELIHAYIPGDASIQDKRSFVSMDFFEYSRLTGETFRYYPVAARNTATSSASSSPAQDSGYASQFVSPVISDGSFSTPASVDIATPASFFQDTVVQQAPKKAPKKAVASSSRSPANDFSHIPGMKIMTRDGLDITNSASRGCKTKEQRDHAHLMRIIKACDACKKKKIRCDPSHKKRTTTQAQAPAPSQSQSRPKPSKKLKQAAIEAPVAAPQDLGIFDASSFTRDDAFADFELPVTTIEYQESWESLVHYDDEPMYSVPVDYDFFFDPAGHFSPGSNSSASSSQPAVTAQPQLVSRPPTTPPSLPYMGAGSSSSNYVDFDLFSPAASFIDDESMPVNDIANFHGERRSDNVASNVRLSSSNPTASASLIGSLPGYLEIQEWPEPGLAWYNSGAETLCVGRQTQTQNTPLAQASRAPSAASPQLPDTLVVCRYVSPTMPMPLTSCQDEPLIDAPRIVSSAARQHSSSTGRGRLDFVSRPRSCGAIGEVMRDIAAANSAPLSSLSPSVARTSQIATVSDASSSTTVAARLRTGASVQRSQFSSSASLAIATDAPDVRSSSVPGTSVVVSSASEIMSSLLPTPHVISVAVACGVLGCAPLSMVVCFLSFVLGLVALGSIYCPQTAWSGTDQRIHKTTPLSRSQDNKQSFLSRRCESWRFTAHNECRHMDTFYPTMGRLATSRLLTLTR
ncbi:uncharacterized protein VDAG_04937 [Verticillium dahliae VdLs.17]|uniref:Uncharacterized protein n=1 Tax=Verticillium dahliae (strain VdLs.17 / ATCC MYA-4575 / FGSC 10137) TaxID=498257 RepID=G2X3F2_VERDV|nr:uncharacterized protein VDAG_04937 [Verticillium dahliae VdLs.17]EGY23499.1 hypothetical protein VDAG_04937 [Verticillium dahliae VdLs.17]